MALLKLPRGQVVDIYDTLGIDVGTQLIVTELSESDVQLWQDESNPKRLDGVSIVTSGATGAYARCASGGAVSVMTEQEAVSSLPAHIFSSLITSTNKGVGRFAVDAQPTSFEDNTEFRFFEDLSLQEYRNPTVDNSIPANKVLVYKFTTTDPVNILLRTLNVWTGGRKYLVFPVDGNETITGGSFEDVSDLIFTNNNNLRAGLSTHPVNNVTVEKRIADSFVTTSDARTGTATKTDGNNNRAISSYQPDGNKSGVAATQSFYLVMFNLDSGSDPTSMLFTVGFEIRYGEGA